MARRKKQKSATPQMAVAEKIDTRWSTRALSFLVGSGILVTLLGVTYQYFGGDVSLEFVEPIGRGYEFQLKNDTPSNRTIKLFRIEPPTPQRMVYIITEDVHATIDNQGSIDLPGGNLSYIPAAEYKELDGQRLAANSSLKFRVPPLTSRTWMTPEATVVDVRYEVESTNSVLSLIEKLLNTLNVRSSVRTVRYVVSGNYWAISQSSSIDEAIRLFCRDNDEMAKSSTCSGAH